MLKKAPQFLVFIIPALIAYLLKVIFLYSYQLWLTSIFFLILIILFILLSRRTLYKTAFEFYQQLFLFVITILILFLVLISGGIISPLFLLIQLTTIALSFFFTFNIGLLFFWSTLAVLLLDGIVFQRTEIAPSDIILIFVYIVSIFATIPLAHIASSHYWSKMARFKQLLNQMFDKENLESIILKSVSEGIIILTNDQKILSINGKAQQLTEINENKAIGKDFFSIFIFKSSSGQRVVKESFPKSSLISSPNGYQESNISISKANGSSIVISFNFTPILNMKGTVTGWLFIFNDITQAIETESATYIYNEALRHIINSAKRLQTPNGRLNDNGVLISNILLPYLSDLQLLDLIRSNSLGGKVVATTIKKTLAQVVEESSSNIKENQIAIEDRINYSQFQPYNLSLNEVKLHYALLKLLQLSQSVALTNNRNKVIIFEAVPQNNRIELLIKATCNEEFPWQNNEALFFHPYSNESSLSSILKQTNGLEGYLARSLLSDQDVNGSVNVKLLVDNQYGPTVTFIVSVPLRV